MKGMLKKLLRTYSYECDFIEIRLEESESISIQYNGEKLDQASKKLDKGGFVRALYKGGWGEASFNNVSDIEMFIKAAIRQAKVVGDSKSLMAPVPMVEDEVYLKLKMDPRNVPFSDKVKLMKDYNDIVLNYNEYIKSSMTVYEETFKQITYANSEGSYVFQEIMDMRGAVVAVAMDGTNNQSAVVMFGSSNDFGAVLNLENEIRQKCQIAVELLRAPKIKSGTYTVICNPVLTGVFAHEAFGHLSEADGVCENEKLKELMTLGVQMGSPVLNIYDSGLVEGTRGYLIYDDEGVKTEKTYLIKEGKLVGRLHNRETAGKMRERPTGNARALSYKFPPICRMRCTNIEAGKSTLEDMLKGIKLGVYALDARGGETNGELFTFSSSYAYMIRDGKIAELVRDVNLTGNVFTTLKNIDMIGDEEIVIDGAGGCGKGEQFPLPVSNGGPHIRIQQVVVGGDE